MFNISNHNIYKFGENAHCSELNINNFGQNVHYILQNVYYFEQNLVELLSSDRKPIDCYWRPLFCSPYIKLVIIQCYCNKCTRLNRVYPTTSSEVTFHI